jgi:hypothetical protein
MNNTCQEQNLAVENKTTLKAIFLNKPLLSPTKAIAKAVHCQSPPPPSSSATTSAPPPGVSPRPPSPPEFLNPIQSNPIQSNKHRGIFKQNPFQVQAKKNQLKQRRGRSGFSNKQT